MHIIIFLWGFTGILGKWIHLDAFHLVWHRLWIAFVSLFICVILFKIPKKISSKKAFLQMIIVGFFVAMHWITFYLSIQFSTASLAVLCLSTTTLHVTWLEPLLLKKKFSWLEFSFGLLVVIGIYIITDDFDKNQYLALGIGLISALCAAIFSVSNAFLIKEQSSAGISLVEFGVGFIMISVYLLSQGKLNESLFAISWKEFGLLLFLGIVCTSFAFLIMIEITKKLGAFTTALSINLEPVYTLLLAIPLLHENAQLGSNFYWGAAFIIGVVVANAVWKGVLKN